MSNLFVIGSCYSDDGKYAKDLFKTLEDAGYTLAYNNQNKTSVSILKEIEDEPEETA